MYGSLALIIGENTSRCHRTCTNYIILPMFSNKFTASYNWLLIKQIQISLTRFGHSN